MLRPIASALGLVALAVGCGGASDVGRYAEQRLNPFAATRVALLAVDRQGPFLSVGIRDRGAELAFYAPAADAACAELLRPEATLTWRRHGNFGRFENDDLRCEATGVGSLAAWRDRRPRDRRDASAVPRAAVAFREVGHEADVTLVRGRFPLASRVGVPSGFDLIAFLPRTDACAPLVARGLGTMEFRAAGRDAIRLVGSAGAPCPVLGFAMPPDGARAAD